MARLAVSLPCVDRCVRQSAGDNQGRAGQRRSWRAVAPAPHCPAPPPSSEGQAFQSMMDLAGLYRVWNPKYKSYSVFGQDHLAQVLLGWDISSGHDAVG